MIDCVASRKYVPIAELMRQNQLKEAAFIAGRLYIKIKLHKKQTKTPN